MFYTLLLTLHNITRWLLIIAAVIALYSAFSGWLGKKAWTKQDDRAGMMFTSLFDLQVLFGLILYFFVSPITTAALRNFGAAMSNSSMRFFAVEHFVMMLIAMGLAHVGRAQSRKAGTDSAKFKRAAIWFTVSVVLLLASIPWPFMAAARPWLLLGGFMF